MKTTTAPKTGVANTIAGQDLTNPTAPALAMPDPEDPVRNNWMRGLVSRRLRGGRHGTILTYALKKLMGTTRTQDPTNTAAPGL